MTAKLTKEGLLRSSPATIFTFGGGTIEPLDPDPNDIDILTIAHSLSQQCRWTGHSKFFYSVAEHCVHVSEIVPSLEALLHDASEAYLSDLARPVKHAPGLGDAYLEVERKLESVIAAKYDLEWPWPEEVKEADDWMLREEANVLVPHLGELMPDPPADTPEVYGWEPAVAERYFLSQFRKLS